MFTFQGIFCRSKEVDSNAFDWNADRTCYCIGKILLITRGELS